ncbi:ervatamin-B-like [Thrips palmi]|uniref:Ervatamin-B-like n=1 Tax=Thrips palmi TaxID=161013 RepID=A0A6P8ZZS8_THRPL|nr:ervatamin-B-like [Thrips palmi]
MWLLGVLFLNSILACLCSDDFIHRWNSFKTLHNKTYSNPEENSRRMEIFRRNVDMVAEHNARYARGETLSYLGINRFSDMEGHELNGNNLDIADLPLTNRWAPRRRLRRQVDTGIQNIISIDWRQKGVVTSVKNEESCGSSWAFSVVGCVESRQALANGQSPNDLSPQQLVDCDDNDSGCNGGNPYNAMLYMQNSGVEGWSSYPYAGMVQSCRYVASKVVAKVSNVDFIQGDEGEERMRQEVQNNGPIAATVNAASAAFTHYAGGIIADASCPTTINHGVVIVGYGLEGPIPYWIVKNSWGSSWGEQGYFRILRGRNICGINTLSVFADAQ